jgi:hypothetical protein
MINLPRGQGDETWRRFWDDAKTEFFKVENLQDYTGEENDQQSSLHLWLQGDKEASLRLIQENNSKWAEQTSSKAIAKIRIHIVDEIYTEYLKWEIEHYKLVNIPLGKEQVFLVKRSLVPNYQLGDFMMFDSKKVVRNHYSLTGRMESRDFYENEAIDDFLIARSLLMKHANEITP